MKQPFARSLLIISLILSLTCFILSLIALHLPRWKTIQLRSTYQPLITVDQHSMDPLIRSEVEKYVDVLYRRGNSFVVHSSSTESLVLLRRNAFIRPVEPLPSNGTMRTKSLIEFRRKQLRFLSQYSFSLSMHFLSDTTEFTQWKMYM